MARITSSTPPRPSGTSAFTPGACRDTAQWTSGPRCFPGAASPGRARPVGLTTGRRRAARRRPRSAGSAASGPSLRRPPPSSAGPSRRSRRAARCTRWVIAAARDGARLIALALRDPISEADGAVDLMFIEPGEARPCSRTAWPWGEARCHARNRGWSLQRHGEPDLAALPAPLLHVRRA